MRSPVKITLTPTVAGGGISPWLILDYLQRPFNVGLYTSLSSDASGITYSVEATPDNPNITKGTKNPVVSLTRVAGVATIAWANPHGLSTLDALKVYNSGDPNLDGDQAVASTPSTTSVTYAVANTGALLGAAYTEAVGLRVFPLAANLTAATTRQSGLLLTPSWAVRLRASAWVAGGVTLEAVQGHARG
jgi:hypothetical protein